MRHMYDLYNAFNIRDFDIYWQYLIKLICISTFTAYETNSIKMELREGLPYHFGKRKQLRYRGFAFNLHTSW